MGIDLTNPSPLYRQIADDIRSQISSSVLKVGDPIGSHQELVRKYNVSLITVKKALTNLINEGLLFSRVGKGTYVAHKSAVVDLSKNKTVGFVLRDLDSPFFSRILSSVEKKLSEKDFNLMLSSTADRSEKEESQINHFLNLGVTGLIIASMSHVYYASPVIHKLHEDNFPYVIVSYIADENINYVGTDHEEGGYIATKHLIKLGYKKIGYINGEEGNILGEVRKAGYMRALQQYGIPLSESSTFQLRLSGEWFNYQSGYEIGEQFLNLQEKPEAFFIYNDLAALGFEKAILNLGLNVPDDVAIVGFDDIKQGRVAPVALTTIHQPIEDIGALAVEMITKMMEGQIVQPRQILKPELVIRESCGAKKITV